ncbi:MAG: hypothetical protein ABW252_06490 [Polyangiales bacterium]
MASPDDAPEVGNGAPDAPQGPPSRPPAPRRRVLGRAALIIGIGSLVVSGAVTGSLAWLLGHLAHPSVKPRIQALAREHAGLEVDYDDLTISLDDGVRARAFRLLQPPKFRRVAQEFLRIDTLDVRMRPLDVALSGGAIDVNVVHLDGVDATVITDEAGATTLSELFPPSTEPAPPPSPTSASLASLPTVDVARLEVTGVRGRLIALRKDASPQTTSAASLGMSGTVHMVPGSLAGTSLKLGAAPSLRIAQTGDEARNAEVGVTLTASADAPRMLRVQLASTLGAQDLVPSWSGGSELVKLDARVDFDPQGGRTLVKLDDAHVAGALLGARGSVVLHDGSPARMEASGTLHAALAKLPLAVEGYAVDALAVDVDAQRLSWDGARLAGALGWKATADALALDDGTQQVKVGALRSAGTGSFDDPVGHVEGDVQVATLALRTPDATARASDVALKLDARTDARGGPQTLDAHPVITLAEAALGTPEGREVSLRGARLDAQLAGTLPELREQRLAKLGAIFAAEAVTASEPGMRATLEQLGAQLAVAGLAPAAASPSGFVGDARAKLTLPALRITQAGGPLSLRDASLDLALPLSLATANGSLALGQLGAPDARVERVGVEIAARNPLGFGERAAKSASLRIDGKVGAVRAGAHRAIVDTLGLGVQRTSESRYQATLDARLASLVLAGKPVPEQITTQLRADADRAAGTLVASAALRGPRGAAITANVDAAFARASGKLRYDAALGAEKLDAFAALLADVAAGTKVAGTRVHATAKGELAGVMRATPDGMVAPTPDPASSARGTQSIDLTVEGLDHRSEGGALAVPALRLKVDSTHREGGAGSAKLSLRADVLRFDAPSGSVHLRALDQEISASFPRDPSASLMDVHAKTTLGAADQSFFPAYKVSDLTLAAHVQVDHLRSFFLRQLDLENPEAGTSLHAKGAIELRTRSTGAGERTLVGREALALEGSLTQALEPFQKLGFAARASGTLRVPFRLESGGLLDYRLLAAIEARDVSLVTSDRGLGVEALTGLIPITEEFALLPSGAVVSAGPRASPLTEARFFDVHPFLGGTDYVTARTITLRGLPPFGPFAANMRLDRSNFLIDQLQVGWNGGQIVGQVRLAYRDGDPLVRMRLNATGVRAGRTQDVLDANAALTYQPRVSTVDGKVQLVRVSPAHLLGILDVVDPFHESTSTNRIRQGLKLGYPKFVRFHLHDGALDTKVELGGVAKVVRIDEIKAVPLGPILQRYVVPTLSSYLDPAPPEVPPEVAATRPEENP